jgi:DNA-binding MarR family transcriptional regulator
MPTQPTKRHAKALAQAPILASALAKPTPLPAQLSIWTTYLLRQATLRAQGQVAASLRALGLKPAHNTVMTLLTDGAMTQIALAARTNTDRTSMVGIIDDLEQLGLLLRLPNPRDRRVHDVTLTTLGHERLRTTQAQVAAADQAFLAPLTAAEQLVLRAMLERLIEHHDAQARPAAAELRQER